MIQEISETPHSRLFEQHWCVHPAVHCDIPDPQKYVRVVQKPQLNLISGGLWVLSMASDSHYYFQYQFDEGQVQSVIAGDYAVIGAA